MLGTLGVSIVSICRILIGQFSTDSMDGVVKLKTRDCRSLFGLLLSY